MFFKLRTKDWDSTYLYRKVPELLDPREPHPRSPEHLNHLHGMAVPLHQVFLHLLDGDSPICPALPLLQLHLHTMQWKQKKHRFGPPPRWCLSLLFGCLYRSSTTTTQISDNYLLEEGGADPQPCLLLHQLQQLLLREGALHIICNPQNIADQGFICCCALLTQRCMKRVWNWTKVNPYK